MKTIKLLPKTFIAILLAGTIVQSKATVYTIGARDTSMQIDLAGGIAQWTVDGVNQLSLQSFYYSIGSGPTASIYSIGAPSAPSITTNISNTTVALNTTYADSTIGVGTLFSLQSSPVGSGRATLAQTLTINNLSATTQVFHFYQFSDFDLGGIAGGQNVQFFNNGSGQPYQVVQTDAFGRTLTGLITGVTGGSSAQLEVQAGLFDGTQFGLGGIIPVTLNNTLTAGPGNVDYAYEFDATLAPGSSITISELQTVPEPSSVALVASGIFALALRCRRRPGGQRESHSGM